MKKLIMTIGLPASGKSTWAKQILAEHPGAYKRVNKDDLRTSLDGGKWSRDNEKFILFVRDLIVVAALKKGKHVIVDDTNLAPKHSERLKQLARENGAEFVIQDFRDIPLDECISRDQKRHNYVGEKVIRGMWNQFIAQPVSMVDHNPSLPNCVICDIDGTVAKMNGRSPYDYSQVHTDTPHVPVIAAVSALMPHYKIVFVSGRKAECRESTERWLMKHVGISSPLHMRDDGDDRDDRIVKQEIYEREIKGKFNVQFVLDDRDRVVRKWRELGLTCFQVAEGDF